MDPAVLLQFLSDGGVLSASLILIWMLVTEKLVPKSRITDTIKERDSLREQQAGTQAALEALVKQIDELDREIEELRRESGLATVRRVGER